MAGMLARTNDASMTDIDNLERLIEAITGAEHGTAKVAAQAITDAGYIHESRLPDEPTEEMIEAGRIIIDPRGNPIITATTAKTVWRGMRAVAMKDAR